MIRMTLIRSVLYDVEMLELLLSSLSLYTAKALSQAINKQTTTKSDRSPAMHTYALNSYFHFQS